MAGSFVLLLMDICFIVCAG